MIDLALLDHVSVTPYDGTGLASQSVSVSPIWRKVDRPCVGGIVIPSTKRKLIERTKRCMEAGAFWSAATIKTDVNGQTYVCATALCMGRHLNADLNRLGY